MAVSSTETKQTSAAISCTGCHYVGDIYKKKILENGDYHFIIPYISWQAGGEQGVTGALVSVTRWEHLKGVNVIIKPVSFSAHCITLKMGVKEL